MGNRKVRTLRRTSKNIYVGDDPKTQMLVARVSIVYSPAFMDEAFIDQATENLAHMLTEILVADLNHAKDSAQ